MTRKITFLSGSNNLGLALGKALKSYTSVAKGLKLKVRKFRGLIPTFVENTGEKLVREPFCPPHSFLVSFYEKSQSLLNKTCQSDAFLKPLSVCKALPVDI